MLSIHISSLSEICSCLSKIAGSCRDCPPPNFLNIYDAAVCRRRPDRVRCMAAELVATLSNDDDDSNNKKSSAVIALTTMDDQLYVARAGSQDIDVFDVQSLALRRRLTAVIASCTATQRTLLPRTTPTVTDMTTCRRHRCLYVAQDAGLVQRLDSSNGKQVHLSIYIPGGPKSDILFNYVNVMLHKMQNTRSFTLFEQF